MRRLLVVVGVALAGCGGVHDDPLDSTLSYFPKDAPLLAVVDTDTGSDQQHALHAIAKRFRFSSQLIPELQDPDLRPVLGNPAVIGASDPRALSDRRQLVVAIRPRHPEKLSDLRHHFVETGRSYPAGHEAGFRILQDRDGTYNAFDGETLVFSQSKPLLSRALRRGKQDEGMDEGEFDDALDGLPGHSLVTLRLDTDALLAASPLGPRGQAAPFFSSAKTVAAKFTARPGALDVRFRMRTEDSVDPEDLPIPEGGASPPVVAQKGQLAIGVRNPGQLLHFLRLAGASFGGTNRYEDRVGVQFQRDVVKQLRGDAAVSLSARGGYAMRATVRDPAAMKRTLATIARRAPDAAREVGRDVVSITPPRDAGGVYRLDRIGRDSAFGLFGNQLVFADTAHRARVIATAPAHRLPGARGALVISAKPEELASRFVDQLAPAGALGSFVPSSYFLRPLGRFDASVQADDDGLVGRATQRFD